MTAFSESVVEDAALEWFWELGYRVVRLLPAPSRSKGGGERRRRDDEGGERLRPKALDAWDRFDHTTSKNLLESVTKSAGCARRGATSRFPTLAETGGKSCPARSGTTP